VRDKDPRRAARRLWRLSYEVPQIAHDQIALQQLSRLPGAYLPWSSAAMRPGGVVAILNDILIGCRRTIVECGSGISTVFIARLLREREGHVYSIEHDPQWADIVESWLEAEDLTDRVTIVRAPLESAERWETEWYAADLLDPITAGPPIDMLIVDGPVAQGSRLGLARYPALPFFRGVLAPGASVILDDIGRAGEQQVMGRWEGEFAISFERSAEEAGTATALVSPGAARTAFASAP